MADRVAVLSHGRLEQFASPTEVYDRPRSFFDNTFVGSSNILPAVVADVSDRRVRATLPDGAVLAGEAAAGLAKGDAARICIDRSISPSAAMGTACPALLRWVCRWAHIAMRSGSRAAQPFKVAAPRAAGGEPLPPARRSASSPSPGFRPHLSRKLNENRQGATDVQQTPDDDDRPDARRDACVSRHLVRAGAPAGLRHLHGQLGRGAIATLLVPAFRRATNNAEMALDPMLSVDQIAKVTAARAPRRSNVMLHDPGPALVAIGQDLVEDYPVAQSAHYKDLISDAQDAKGPAPFFQVVGSPTTPTRSRRRRPLGRTSGSPSTRVASAITNLNSTLGTGFLVEIARMRGGSEANVDAGFKAIEELRPNLGAVAANPGSSRRFTSRDRSTSVPAISTRSRSSRPRGVPVSSSRRRRALSPSRPRSMWSRIRPTGSWRSGSSRPRFRPTSRRS